MWWIEDTDAVPVMPAITQAKTTEKHFFSDGDPQMRRNATVVTEEFMNILQCELMNLIEGVGMELKKDDMSQVLKAVRSVAARAGGILLWDQGTDYTPLPWIVWGRDFKIYVAIQPSGPGTAAGAQDPTATTGYWHKLGDYEAIPDTICLRSSIDGRTQVGNAIHDMDAINFRTMRDYVARYGGGRNVATPAILSPDPETVMEALEFQVTVSALELTAGGTPLPFRTRWRILSQDAMQILAYGEEPYTTTPTLIAPNALSGGDFLVIVQHEDGNEGDSPWSDRVHYKMAPAVLETPRVIVPANGSMGIIAGALAVTVTPGVWSDESDFDGAQTRLVMFDALTGMVVWDSSFVAYTTEFTIPQGVLRPSSRYAFTVQHTAGTAPASNPSAVLTTAGYTYDSGYATKIDTAATTPPNVADLQHTIPATIEHGTSAKFKIWGAVSTDGGVVTYSIPQSEIAGGLSFSKYEGITDNEELTVTAPTISAAQQAAGLEIVAVSSFGAMSENEAVPVIIKATPKTVSTPSVSGGGTINSGSTGSINVYGSVASDGTAVTYEVTSYSGIASISPTAGIANNGAVSFRVNTLSSSGTWSITVRARSASGVYSSTRTVSGTILTAIYDKVPITHTPGSSSLDRILLPRSGTISVNGQIWNVTVGDLILAFVDGGVYTVVNLYSGSTVENNNSNKINGYGANGAVRITIVYVS